ncbi:MAG: aminotransferase class III-fold pyridoxal phosphate-dependent enzyme [Firmicutes bacterium]|nr:aminotransferase class III-fold pyridoxal phosphate-dependent enzyme [Bacillota bacterium]
MDGSRDILNPTLFKILQSFKLDKEYVRGQGHYLYDREGRSYLDFIAQYGAVPFGYNHPEIWAAVQEFAEAQGPSLVQPSVPPWAVKLANMLATVAPGELTYCTLSQSGAEAVEAAIKLARSATRRPVILSTYKSFHGKTLGALSATGREVYQKPFYAPAPGFAYIPYNDLQALEDTLKKRQEEIAAFIIEPVQGEGGVVVPAPGYLKGAEEICHRHGVLLILDEIQTGLGRTGYLFAAEKEKVQPDIMLLSKALGGGLVPIGACLSTPAVWNEEFGSKHSSTFANNNFTCAVAIRALEMLLRNNRQLVCQVALRGEYLKQKLGELQKRWPGVIKEVRGEGLLVGLEFYKIDGSRSYDLSFMCDQGGFSALLAGMLLNVFGIRCAPFLNNPMTVRLEPALTIEYAEIDRVVEALDEICAILEHGDYAWLYRYVLGDKRRPENLKDYRHLTRPIVASQVESTEVPTGKFAFLIHYPGTEDLVKNTPAFQQFTEHELEALMAWEAEYPKPGVVCHMPALRSNTGKLVEGWLIGVPYGAHQMMNRPREEVVEVIKEAVDLGRKLGAEVVGLGAYTSVVTRGGLDVLNRGVAITSGNSFTIVTAVEAALLGARKLEIDLANAEAAVVGATGSIGQVAALLLAEKVARLNLIGNQNKRVSSTRRLERLAEQIIRHCWNKALLSGQEELIGLPKWLFLTLNRLKSRSDEMSTALADEVVKAMAAQERTEDGTLLKLWTRVARVLGDNLPLVVTVDLEVGLSNADIVITATNATQTLINPPYLKSGAVVCDVARPPDVSKQVSQERDDVLILEGGLVELPEPVAFGQNLGYRNGLTLACLSETIMLCMEGEKRDFSVGHRIPLEHVEYLRVLANKHGFRVAELRTQLGEVTEADFARVREKSKQRRMNEHLRSNKI